MSKQLKLSTEKAPVPKPAPTIFLEETKFDLENGNDYSVEVTSEGVVVYSECCADTMTRETALKLYHALGNYLASTPE